MSNSDLSPAGVNESLQAFIHAGSEPEAQGHLEGLLVHHAEPLIRKAVRRRIHLLASQSGTLSPEKNVEDICGEARLNLVRSLRRMRENPAENAIRNFPGYVFSILFQVWDKQLRQMHPERWRLKNQIRYLLRHHPGFSLWETSDGMAAGLAAWKGRKADSPDGSDRELLENVQDAVKRGPDGSSTRTVRLARLLEAIFARVGGPLDLDTLVHLVAGLQGISSGAVDDAAQDPEDLDRLPDPGAGIDEQFELRECLRRLWSEICELPVRQRMSILLSLRDSSGRTLVPLLPLLQLATVPEIATQLGIKHDELKLLWNRLPLDDAALAGILAISRQQVVNLRKAGRKRLARRMNLFSSGGHLSSKSTSTTSEGSE